MCAKRISGFILYAELFSKASLMWSYQALCSEGLQAWGLMFCGHCHGILNNFIFDHCHEILNNSIFEFVFCKCSPMGHRVCDKGLEPASHMVPPLDVLLPLWDRFLAALYPVAAVPFWLPPLFCGVCAGSRTAGGKCNLMCWIRRG